MPEKIKWIKVFSNDNPLISARDGKPIRVVIGSKRICLAYAEGSYYAVSDICPHQGASISNGFIEKNAVIVCPMHQFPFSLRTGKHISEDSCGGLEIYPVEEREDGLYIGIRMAWWDF